MDRHGRRAVFSYNQSVFVRLFRLARRVVFCRGDHFSGISVVARADRPNLRHYDSIAVVIAKEIRQIGLDQPGSGVLMRRTRQYL